MDELTILRLTSERDKLTFLIDDGSYREQHNKLFAARQALCWAINPESAASPFQSIMGLPEDFVYETRPPVKPKEVA